MRKTAILILLLLPLAYAGVQTLEEMGVSKDLLQTFTTSEIEIPYSSESNCTPFAIIIHNGGSLRAYDNNEEVLATDKTGVHRIILHNRAGVLRILLKRKEGEAEAKISEKSIVGCEKIPVVEMNVEVPGVWTIGDITHVRYVLRNTGTEYARGYLQVHPPRMAAALAAPKEVEIPPGGTVTVDIPFITVEKRELAIFPSQCFVYSDPFGRWTVCSKDLPITTKFSPKATCVQLGENLEIINTSYVEFEVNGKSTPPGASETLEFHGEEPPKSCQNVLKADLRELGKKEDKSALIAIILLLFGVLGMVLSQKRLKTPKA